MRLRAKPWAKTFIEENQQCIFNEQNAQQNKGNWQETFGNKNPIWVEIGSGKGQFILGMAQKYPEFNFIGMEIQETAIAIAARLAVESEQGVPKNLLYIYGNGSGVETYFDEKEINKIFLNHSDPWPKEKHAKRRLTSPRFLTSYKHVLNSRGLIELKTDNKGLFLYSLEMFKLNSFVWDEEKDISFDLHSEIEKLPENVETEYEEKFSKKGQAEYWVRVRV